MYINFRSQNFYTFELFIAIVMYCQILFLLFTGKQHCLQTNKYDQSCGITEIYTPTQLT